MFDLKKESIISARHLTIGYPKTRSRGASALYNNMEFDLYKGELTCLLGSNGAGKSTLLRTISGIQTPLNGTVLLNEKEVKLYSEDDLSKLLGLVLTDKTTAGGLTVSELVGLGRYPYTGFWGRLSKEDHRIVEQAMNDVCILHKKDSYISELSDGERQKVMIAKALAQECPIIILDEPTAFLDVVNRIEIMNLLHLLASTQNKTILLSTHDVELALTLGDRLWLLARDKGLKTGVTEDIILSGAIDTYIGNGSVSFEKETGRFTFKQNEQKKIRLIAEGELYYWAKNFLSRRGYTLIGEKEETSTVIHILDLDTISVSRNGNSKMLSSFEELDLCLRD